ADELARVEVEADVVHRAHGPALHGVLDRQVAHAQHCAARVFRRGFPGGRIGEDSFTSSPSGPHPPPPSPFTGAVFPPRSSLAPQSRRHRAPPARSLVTWGA